MDDVNVLVVDGGMVGLCMSMSCSCWMEVWMNGRRMVDGW
jgi:hypothetical protein